MEKVKNLITEHPSIVFVSLTLLISLISFGLMIKVPNAQTPESKTGLPIWLIAIWSPNIAAIFIWTLKGDFLSNIKLAFSFTKISGWWLIVLVPLLIAALLLLIEISKGETIEWSNFKWHYFLPLIFINLLMGPLGEELGWRAFLYPDLKQSYGWMASALVVGVIWSLWHGPLWFLDSPQSKIPFWAFSINVVVLSVLMAMIYNHSQGSIIAIVLLHLTFNVSLGIIDILGSHQPGQFVIKSLYLYVPLVMVLVIIHEFVSKNKCSINSI
jgi:membrane protease YdiL (CAAX protease family)